MFWSLQSSVAPVSSSQNCCSKRDSSVLYIVDYLAAMQNVDLSKKPQCNMYWPHYRLRLVLLQLDRIVDPMQICPTNAFKPKLTCVPVTRELLQDKVSHGCCCAVVLFRAL